MAELADALDLGSSIFDVQVRFLLAAYAAKGECLYKDVTFLWKHSPFFCFSLRYNHCSTSSVPCRYTSRLFENCAFCSNFSQEAELYTGL